MTKKVALPLFELNCSKDFPFRNRLLHQQPMKEIPFMEFQRISGRKPFCRMASNIQLIQLILNFITMI